MPIPFIAAGAVAKAATVAAGAGAAYVAHKSGKKKGEKEGYNRGKEEAEARINVLTKKLHELQVKREKTKDIFEEVVSGISNIDTNDDNFFSKIASLIKGYKEFHIFTLVAISYTKYRCLEHKLRKDDSRELKKIVLGLIEAGFPDKLKNNISEVWESKDKAFVGSQFEKYKNKLPKTLELEFKYISRDINELVKDFKQLSINEREVNDELKKLKSA